MKSNKNNTSLDKFLLLGLVVLNGLFLLYWGVLAYYSQLHHDDLHFLWKLREMSIFEYVRSMYYCQSGRFVGYSINGVVSKVINLLGFHKLWAAFYYAVGISICWLVVRDIKLPISRFGKFMCVCFIYNLYILTNIDFPVFFWLCAMSYYLALPMAALFLKYINEEKLNWWEWVILVILTVFIGGGSEAFSPIVLLMLFVNGLYWWHSMGWKVKDTWELPQVKRIVWTALALLVLLVIVVAAPGNYARLDSGEDFSHPSCIAEWVKAMAKAVAMFFWFMAFYIPYYLIAFVGAFYLGGKIDLNLPSSKWKVAMVSMATFVVYLIVSSIPCVYLYNGFGIQRNYTHVVFMMLLFTVMMGFVMGGGRKSKVSGWISASGIVLLIAIMCVNISQDAPTARRYGKAVDKRIEYLSALRDMGQKATVVVDPLPIPYTEDVKHFVLTCLGRETPKPVLYYVSEADTVPNVYEFHMKRVLDLDFDFVLAKEQQK